MSIDTIFERAATNAATAMKRQGDTSQAISVQLAEVRRMMKSSRTPTGRPVDYGFAVDRFGLQAAWWANNAVAWDLSGALRRVARDHGDDDCGAPRLLRLVEKARGASVFTLDASLHDRDIDAFFDDLVARVTGTNGGTS